MTMLVLAPGDGAQSTVALAPGAFRIRVPHRIAGDAGDTHDARSNEFSISAAP
jgi:hypothetical protein